MANTIIQVNNLKITFAGKSCGGELCPRCAWKSTCSHEITIDQLSIRTKAEEVNVGVEINQCSYFLPKTPKNL